MGLQASRTLDDSHENHQSQRNYHGDRNPTCNSEVVVSQDKTGTWSMIQSISVDGDNITVFEHNPKLSTTDCYNDVQSMINTARTQFKSLRHPSLVKMEWEQIEAGVISIVTEPLFPFRQLAQTLCEDEVIAGLADILSALLFLNEGNAKDVNDALGFISLVNDIVKQTLPQASALQDLLRQCNSVVMKTSPENLLSYLCELPVFRQNVLVCLQTEMASFLSMSLVEKEQFLETLKYKFEELDSLTFVRRATLSPLMQIPLINDARVRHAMVLAYSRCSVKCRDTVALKLLDCDSTNGEVLCSFLNQALQDQFYCLLRRRDAATILVLGYIFSSIAAFLPKHLVITAAEMFKKGLKDKNDEVVISCLHGLSACVSILGGGIMASSRRQVFIPLIEPRSIEENDTVHEDSKDGDENLPSGNDPISLDSRSQTMTLDSTQTSVPAPTQPILELLSPNTVQPSSKLPSQKSVVSGTINPSAKTLAEREARRFERRRRNEERKERLRLQREAKRLAQQQSQPCTEKESNCNHQQGDDDIFVETIKEKSSQSPQPLKIYRKVNLCESTASVDGIPNQNPVDLIDGDEYNTWSNDGWDSFSSNSDRPSSGKTSPTVDNESRSLGNLGKKFDQDTPEKQELEKGTQLQDNSQQLKLNGARRGMLLRPKKLKLKDTSRLNGTNQDKLVSKDSCDNGLEVVINDHSMDLGENYNGDTQDEVEDLFANSGMDPDSSQQNAIEDTNSMTTESRTLSKSIIEFSITTINDHLRPESHDQIQHKQIDLMMEDFDTWDSDGGNSNSLHQENQNISFFLQDSKNTIALQSDVEQPGWESDDIELDSD